MSWSCVPLSTALVQIEAGSSPLAEERPAGPGEYGVLKLSAISWREFDATANKALLPGTRVEGIPTVRAGDLLISRANTAELIGSVVLVKRDHPNLLLSDKTLRLDVDADIAHPPFLLHALRMPSARAHIEQCATGTSFSMRNISQDKLGRIPIPLPPLPEQRRIADILNKADALRAMRCAALAQLDALTQAIFFDMFGDPATNPNGWPAVSLGDLIAIGPQNGLYKPANEYGSGTPILRIDGFYDGVVTGLATLKRVRLSDQERTVYGLKPGDIVINRVNSREYLGKSAIVPNLSEAVAFESNMMRIALDRAQVDPAYLIHALQTRPVRNHILRSAKDAVNQSSINQQDVKTIPILLPPLPVQRRFVELQAKVQTLRQRQRDSLAQLDALFASLQHRAFRGEL